ncbi:MAG TPA: hypothetical protein VJ464_02615 [Blastocatellia bacterium]|nr:hypothetical protein [Blastocatellia bacterium]
MKDDYLWDGSGEPDPDIEEIEKALGSLRFQARPLDARIEQQLSARRPFFWLKYAAAAAILVMAVAAAWLLLAPGNPPPSELHAILKTPEAAPPPPGPVISDAAPVHPPVTASVNAPPAGKRSAAPVHVPDHVNVRKHAPQAEPDVIHQPPTNEAAPVASEVAMASPIANPFVDADTGRHIERAQMLLRSFRNSEGGSAFDLAYERQSARRLLANNVLLRRAAEARGNLPVGDLLGSLEPFLLDIANLADAPVPDDVRTIKARMEKKEIITALQVYAAPTLSRAF